MRCFLTLVSLLLSCAAAAAADWPQWLGPHRDGSTAEKIAPWKEAPRVLWRKAVGEGHSSPVVAGGKVFVHAKVKDADEEEVLAYDAQSGEQVWRQTYKRGKFTSVFGNGPRATPTVNGGRVYTLGVTGILTCLDAGKGKQLWQLDTLKEFKAANLVFGVSCSPLFEDGKILVNVGGKGASIVAFDNDKGDVVWKGLDDRASYSSPIALGKGKERQVIFMTQKGVVSLNPADGSPYWQFPLQDLLFETSSTPTRAGDVLLASSITFGSVGLKLERKDDKPAAEQAWKNTDLTCYFSTPVAVGKEHIFMVTGTNPLSVTKKTEATLRCIEATSGKVQWSRPKVGKYHATLLRLGDDKLLMMDDAGTLKLLAPSFKEYEELASSKICGETWAHPALANGRLYVRDAKELICLQVGE